MAEERFTAEQKAKLEAVIRKWLRLMAMSSWSFKINWDEPSSIEGAILEIRPNQGRQHGALRVGSYFDCPEYEDNAGCHEALHLLVDPLWQSIMATLEQLGPQAKEIVEAHLREQMERLVDWLAGVMAPVGGQVRLAEKPQPD